MPEEFQRYGERWQELHPNWRMCLWTEDNIPRLINQRLFDEAEQIAPMSPGQLKADVLRYELLYRYGGVWIDCDFEPRKPIDELLVGVECFAAWEQQDVWINNALMGAVPNHPFIRRLIDGLESNVEAHKGQRPNKLTGPQYLTRIWRENPQGVVVMPQKFFYPYSFDELHRADEDFPEAYSIHRWDNARRRREASGDRRGGGRKGGS